MLASIRAFINQMDWTFESGRLGEIGALGLDVAEISPETLRRIRLISLTTLAMCAIGAVSAMQFWRLEMVTTSLLTAGTSLLGLLNLALLRATKRTALCGHLAMGILTAILVVTSAASGGYYNPSFSWFYIIPLCASVVVRLRGAAFWTLVALGGIVAFWSLPNLGVELANQIPAELRTGNALFTRVLCLVAIAGIGVGFVSAQRRAEIDLARATNSRRREAAYTELVMHAAVSANEAESFEAAMRESVERICKAMDWLGGHICHVNDDGSIVSSGFFHQEKPGPYKELMRFTEQRVCAPGEGMAGRAVERRRVEYVDDVTKLSQEGRAPVAQQLGFRSALAVPVFVGGEIPAVLEFISLCELPDVEHLVEIFEHIGVQLGRVAERAEQQERIRQAQKMEAVGQLAAGIAHEINNPMSYVRTNLHALQKEWAELTVAQAEEPPVPATKRQVREFRELIEESLEGVERTIDIVKNVNEFSHSGGGDVSKWQPSDLSQLLDAAHRVAAGHAPVGVHFKQEYAGKVRCLCSPNQLTQVFVNVIVNAIQAVGQQGTIHLSSGGDDRAVFVRVQDDGQGMSESTRQRLFDPFFTTKPVGEGTGLGLSVSYEIVRGHGGEIVVQSVLGEGSTIEIRLPALGT